MGVVKRASPLVRQVPSHGVGMADVGECAGESPRGQSRTRCRRSRGVLFEEGRHAGIGTQIFLAREARKGLGGAALFASGSARFRWGARGEIIAARCHSHECRGRSTTSFPLAWLVGAIHGGFHMTDFRWLPIWIALTLSALAPEAFAAPPKGPIYDHVLLISIDGLHAVDLSNYITANPNSTLATLAKNGVRYPNALTTAPSDSFPGLLAPTTGGTSRSTGVFYDDSYDRQ